MAIENVIVVGEEGIGDYLPSKGERLKVPHSPRAFMRTHLLNITDDPVY